MKSKSEQLHTPDILPEQKWQEIEKHFADILTQCSSETEITHGLIWRGLDPEDALALLDGTKDGIDLDPRDFPNACDDWTKAISYTSAESTYPFNLTLGFTPGETCTVRKANLNLIPDMPLSAAHYQQGNVIVRGRLSPDMIYMLAVRPHGTEPGKPGLPKIYKIGQDALLYHINQTVLQKRLTEHKTLSEAA